MIKEFQNIAIMAKECNITFTQLLDYINLFSKYTPQNKGDRTLIFSENREGWIYAFFSVWQNKGVAVPVDASSTISDVLYILNDCKPQCIWTSKERLSVAEEAVKESGLPIQILLIDDYEQVSCPQREGKLYIQEDGIFTAENKDMALIIYTSGTTGSPKGVMISYANLYANCHSVTVDVPCGDGVASSGRRMPSAVPNVYAWSPASVSVVPPETPSAKRTASVAVTEAAPSRTSRLRRTPVPTVTAAPS